MSATSAEPAVRLRGVTKHYGAVRAVDGLDLDIPRGSIFGLIGPNGAGKTTTFAMIASLLAPTSGTIEVLGIDPARDPLEVRRALGFMPDALGVYDGVRVDEYLRFFAGAYRIPRRRWPDLISGLLELVDLADKRDAPVNSLSRGMKQRLSLARAMVHDPEVLVLDEPASGLDPRARVELRLLLAELRLLGKTIVVSSHILAELAELCTVLGIMQRGQLVTAGPLHEIAARLGGHREVRVRFRDGTEEQHVVSSPDEQAALLRSLVLDESRQVVEFAEVGTDLENVFLQLTENPFDVG